ncbi:hypothetical protein D3C80_1296770 [compost metagenome]
MKATNDAPTKATKERESPSLKIINQGTKPLNKMNKDANNEAPVEIPIKAESTSGFLKIPCNAAPETANPAPIRQE